MEGEKERTFIAAHPHNCVLYFQIGLQPQLHALQCLAARQRHIGHVRGSADMAETVAHAPAHARGHIEHLAAFGRCTPSANWPHYRTAAGAERHRIHRLPAYTAHQWPSARNIWVSVLLWRRQSSSRCLRGAMKKLHPVKGCPLNVYATYDASRLEATEKPKNRKYAPQSCR